MSNFEHTNENVQSLCRQLDNDIEEYSAILDRLKKKFDEINASPKWTDDVVKDSFNSTAMDYMESFNNLLKALQAYTRYLPKKSASADELEKAYS